MKKSSDILLSLGGERLEVFKTKDFVGVLYKGAEISDGLFLTTTYGTGLDYESACDDYLEKIRGKKLVFGAYTDSRHEVMVIG
jgi:hypothetical protein